MNEIRKERRTDLISENTSFPVMALVSASVCYKKKILKICQFKWNYIPSNMILLYLWSIPVEINECLFIWNTHSKWSEANTKKKTDLTHIHLISTVAVEQGLR